MTVCQVGAIGSTRVVVTGLIVWPRPIAVVIDPLLGPKIRNVERIVITPLVKVTRHGDIPTFALLIERSDVKNGLQLIRSVTFAVAGRAAARKVQKCCGQRRDGLCDCGRELR